MSERFVLDTHAVLAFLQDEPGAEMVAQLITSGETVLFMSVINLGEAYYVTLRTRGEHEATTLERKIFETGTIQIAEASWARVKAAAQVKAAGRLSYADSFSAALAQEMDAMLVTGDPEFRRLEEKGVIRVLWLGGSEGIQREG